MAANRRAVAARIARLSGETAASLVADLWTARGYAANREGAIVTVRHRGSVRTVGVVPARRLRAPPIPSADLDVVIALGGAETVAGRIGSGVRVLEPDDLAGMVLYAVDRPVARSLCERHLGAEPTALGRSAPSRLGGYARSLAKLLPAAVALVAVVAAIAGGFALAGSMSDPAGGDLAPAAVPEPSASEVTAVDPETRTGTAVEDYPPGASAAMPPGLTLMGIGDIAVLGRAHSEALKGESYRLTVRRSRPADPDNVTTGPLDDRRYLIQALVQPGVTRVSRFSIAGDRYLLNASLSTGSARTLTQVYHEGSDWHVLSNLTGNRSYRRSSIVESTGPDPASLRRLLVRRYLSTPDSKLTGILDRENGTLYRVVGSGTPVVFPPDLVENYTVVALIDSRGVVRRLSADYRIVDGRETFRIRVEISHTGIGTTEVTTPAWYGEGDAVTSS